MSAIRRMMMAKGGGSQVYELHPEGTDNGRITPITVAVTTGQTAIFEFWADGVSCHGSAYLYDGRRTGAPTVSSPIFCTSASLGVSGQDNYWNDRGRDATRTVAIVADGVLTIAGKNGTTSDNDKFFGKYIKVTII